MKKKQFIGFLIAAVVFVAVGVGSVLTNAYSSKETSKSQNELKTAFESIYGGEDSAFKDMPVASEFVAVVPIKGTIQASSGVGASSLETYNHDMLMEYIDLLMESDVNKGIILRLDTPGGAVYEADELYLKLEEYKEKTKRPIWAYMESQCCSGGVYIAASADEQYANRNTTTGSIGVIMSTYNMTELYKKLGIEEVNITSGANKAMGSSGEVMTSEQRAILQSFVDEYYEQFVKIVADGRKMSVADVKKLADGRIYTAQQAVKNGLIDGVKSSDEFDAYVKEQCGVDKFYEPQTEPDFFSQFFNMSSKPVQKSEAEVLIDFMNSMESGVPMYYAK